MCEAFAVKDKIRKNRPIISVIIFFIVEILEMSGTLSKDTKK